MFSLIYFDAVLTHVYLPGVEEGKKCMYKNAAFLNAAPPVKLFVVTIAPRYYRAFLLLLNDVRI